MAHPATAGHDLHGQCAVGATLSAMETVSEVRARGIRCSGFFMVGFLWETAGHIARTVDFATSLELDALYLFSATPLPGSGLYETAGRPGLPDDI